MQNIFEQWKMSRRIYVPLLKCYYIDFHGLINHDLATKFLKEHDVQLLVKTKNLFIFPRRNCEHQ